MTSTLRSTLALVFAAVVLVAPASASAAALGTQASAATQPRGHVSFYREALRAQIAEARFYESTSTSTRGDSNKLGDVLVACLILLAGAGAVAAWWFNRGDAPSRIAAAH